MKTHVLSFGLQMPEEGHRQKPLFINSWSLRPESGKVVQLARDDLAQVDGVIMDVLAGGNFSVQLPNGKVISAKLSGRMRKFHIRVILGDRVTVGVSPYDPTHGLILHRHKGGSSHSVDKDSRSSGVH